MRILIVNSLYSAKYPSGESNAVRDQQRALSALGHEVFRFELATDELSKSLFYGFKSAFGVMTGFGNSPIEIIRKFKPDLIHVHNLFPNLGSNWMQKVDCPLVVTLHNYRTICSNGILFTKESNCELCPSKSRLHSLRNACYRNSKLATFPVAISIKQEVQHHSLIKYADAVVVLSERSSEKFQKYSSAEFRNKVHLIPNFYNIPRNSNFAILEGNPWVYAGRLSYEKGILQMLRGWPQGLPLVIAGSGELENRIRKEIDGKDWIQYLGLIEEDRVYELLRATRKFVFPSVWIEGGPLVFLQALAASSQCVATRQNGVGDEISRYNLGKTVEFPEEIGNACKEVDNQNSVFQENSKNLYTEKFTQEVWSLKMNNLYKMLLE